MFVKRKTWLTAAGFVVIALIVAWLSASFLVVHKLTERRDPVAAESIGLLANEQVESLRITASDGVVCGAWYIEGSDASAPSVLLLHSNGGSRSSMQGVARVWLNHGAGVLLISLRAHGDSEGQLNDLGYSARHDVVAAMVYLRERRPAQPLIIHGVSLGAAAGIFAAKEPEGIADAYILEAPYRDLNTAAKRRTALMLPPVFDCVAYAGMRITAPWQLDHHDDISPVRHIANIPDSSHLTLFAGRRDQRTPVQDLQDLFDAAHSHAELIVTEAGHATQFRDQPEVYLQAIQQCLDQLADASESPSR